VNLKGINNELLEMKGYKKLILKGFKLRRKLFIQIFRCCKQYNNEYVNEKKKMSIKIPNQP